MRTDRRRRHMSLRRSFRRDKIDIFLPPRRNRFSIHLERNELPKENLILHLRPKLQHFVVTACFRADHVASRGDGEIQTELIEARFDSAHWDGSPVRLDLVLLSNLVLERGMWVFLVA